LTNIDSAVLQPPARGVPGRGGLHLLVAASAALLGGVWLTSPHHALEGLAHYLPLHTFLETLSIVVAALVFGVSWNAFRAGRSPNAALMGAGFLAVALLDFGHALSYAGMPDFVTPASPEKAIWFWLAARFVAAATLLGVALRRGAMLARPGPARALLAAFLGAAALAYVVVLFHPALLPRMFVEGQGLTEAKVDAEFALFGLLAAAATLFYRESRRSGSRRVALLAAAAAISAVSELCFALYSTVTDAFNLLGHVYKVAAYLLIYRAVFVSSVREPFERLAEREVRLRESEDRYRSLVETMAEGVLMVGPGGRCLACNESAARMMHLPREQIFGRTARELGVEMLAEDGQSFEPGPALRALETGTPLINRVIGMRRPGSPLVWTRCSSRPVFREGENKPYAAVTTFHDITGQHEAELALREREAGLRHAQEMAGLAHVVVGPDGSHERWSENWPRLLGLEGAPLPRSTRESLGLVHVQDRERFRATVIEAGRSGRRGVLEYRMVRPDGEIVHVHQTMEPIGDAGGGAPHWFVTVQDVTEQKRFEERIRRLNRVYAVLSGINAAIVRIRDRQELFDEACRVAVEAGQFRMAWIGVVDRAAGLVRPVAWAGAQVRSFLDVAPLAILDTGPGGQGLAGRAVREARPVVSNDVASDPQRLMKKECAERGINSLAVLPLVLGGEVTSVLALYAGEVGVFVDDEMRLLLDLAGDISFALDHIEKEERVRYLAYYDPITGLANRTLFLERLAQHLAAADRAGQKVALLILNIERFKTINDTLGRPAGDALLKEFAARLQRAAGRAELVARVGADHFAVVILNFRVDEQLINRFERGDARVKATPFSVAGQELRISTRAGVALYPQDARDADRLFRNAEAALKRAQTGQKYLFYTEEMTGRIAEKLALENELRRALERNEFVLHYQPKIDLASRRITGVEALIRWASPTRGLVAPGEFIPLLEETGLILPVGSWAMAQAVRDHLAWQRAGLAAVPIAVNVSAMQLRQADFEASVRQALAEGASPPGIELEITESLIMEDVAANIGTLRAVHALGVNIAIDDFGTGYSSLGYLARLPVQSLKIDRSFVVGMAQDSDTMSLVSTIVSLARSLRLKVIAEGVETELQESFLRAMRCDEAQGYLFGRAVPAEGIAAALRDSRA
jgi:diguanylate cyclase (GGDEF)-like protein/PAS domain S-box-containing protein